MSLQLRRFEKSDLALAKQRLEGPPLKCVTLLFDRPSAEHLYVTEPSYGQVLWEDRQLAQAKPTFAKPVGLVLRGALEVTEHFIFNGIQRRRPTKILRPGDFFGLFEAVGDLYGFWRITAGVQHFLVTNPLGDANVLSRKGWKGVSKRQLRTLTHSKLADFDYSELVRFALARYDGKGNAPHPWSCCVLLFDLNEIRNPEAERLILKTTVGQLASLVRQNPLDSMFPESAAVDEKADQARVAATLEAILRDDIPILVPYRQDDHETYGPFAQVVESIRHLIAPIGSKATEPPQSTRPAVHLWVPDDWSRTTGPGALYLDALSGRFDMKAANLLLNIGTRSLSLRSGTRIEHLGKLGDHAYRVRMTTSSGQAAILDRIALHRGSNRIPPAVHAALFGDEASAKSVYGWPLHLGNGFLIRRDE